MRPRLHVSVLCVLKFDRKAKVINSKFALGHLYIYTLPLNLVFWCDVQISHSCSNASLSPLAQNWSTLSWLLFDHMLILLQPKNTLFLYSTRMYIKMAIDITRLFDDILNLNQVEKHSLQVTYQSHEGTWRETKFHGCIPISSLNQPYQTPNYECILTCGLYANDSFSKPTAMKLAS